VADPHVIERLDGFDRLTVTLYRLGLALSGVGLLAVVTLYGLRAAGVFVSGGWLDPLLLAMAAAVALSAACVHLYDKRIRWFIAGCAPAGLALQAAGLAVPDPSFLGWPLQVAGVGVTLISLSALAFKEWFCFRIPGLRLVPVFLGLGTLVVLIDWPLGVVLLWAPAGVLVVLLTIAKVRMPLTHDIGDRSKYQV